MGSCSACVLSTRDDRKRVLGNSYIELRTLCFGDFRSEILISLAVSEPNFELTSSTCEIC